MYNIKQHIIFLLFLLFSGSLYSKEFEAKKFYRITEYKIGVLLFKSNYSVDPNSNDYIGNVLDNISASIAEMQPQRQNTSKRVELVIELEVSWRDTDTHGFGWYQQFASICEEKNIKWTPLLSPHYMPDEIPQLYSQDALTPEPAPFLPLSPSSKVWEEKVVPWIQSFITAMNGHFGSSKAIEEMLVGNEMMYPATSTLTTYDEATKKNWRIFKADSTAELPTTLTEEFADFRSKQLSYCIVTLLNAAKNQLNTLGHSDIGISSKLYPYFFPRANNTFASPQDRNAGYSNSELGFINSQSLKFLAVDSYTTCPPLTTVNWQIEDDYKAAKARTIIAPMVSNALYISEYNKYDNCAQNSTYALNEQKVYDDGLLGFKSYNVRYFVFFAWNPDSQFNYWQINEAQISGLRRLFNWVVPSCPTCTAVRSENQENNRDFSETEITLNINPNPVIDKLNINITNLEEEYSFYIVNMFGQKIYHKSNVKNQVSIDASIFESGVYTLVIQTQSGDKLINKFIKT